MERDSQELGPFDGILGPPDSTHRSLARATLSPTSLERYATCPFQYFAEKILKLEPVRAIRADHLPALTLGTLIHDTLRLSYERLTALQWPEASLDGFVVRQLISESTAEVFTDHAAARGTGHALLWTMAQEQIIELVACVAASDQEDFRTTGYRPQAFETEAEGRVSLGSGARNLDIHGTLDRIDLRLDPPGLRIVDYKLKQGSEMKTEDRNLLLGAARGLRLQPPLYAAMSLPSLPAPTEVQLVYLAPRWDPPIVRSLFERARLAGKTGDTIMRTLRTLVQGIERQEFFILPDGYCDQCVFPSACRRNDQTVWWRSHRSHQARTLRRLRKIKVADE